MELMAAPVPNLLLPAPDRRKRGRQQSARTEASIERRQDQEGLGAGVIPHMSL